MSEHHIFVSVNGVSKTPQEWANDLGISVPSFFMRLQDGRNVDDQLFGKGTDTESVVKPATPSSKKTFKKDRKSRKKIMLTLKGETKSLQEWCEVIGIGMTSLRYRIEKGFSEEDILKPRQATNSKKLPILHARKKKSVPKSTKSTVPNKSKDLEKKKTVTLLGKELPLSVWAKSIGITVNALNYRIENDWSEKEVLYGRDNQEPIVKKNANKLATDSKKKTSKLDKEVCYEGEIKTLREWSLELGISEGVIRNRMKCGKKGRELLMPVKEVEARVEVKIGNKALSFRQWAERTGISEDLIRSRYNNGVRGEQLIFLEPTVSWKRQA